MGREMAGTAERTGSAMGVGSPLILWEGGRDGAGGDSARGFGGDRRLEPLGLAVDSQRLFPELPATAAQGPSPLDGHASPEATAPMPRLVPGAPRRARCAPHGIRPRSAGPRSRPIGLDAMGIASVAPALPVARLGAPATSPRIDHRPLDWRLLWASLVLCLAVAIGAMVARDAVLDAARAGLRWEDHTVVAGETIDSILSARDLPDVGIGRLVDWVEERNGLEDAAIVPGQVLSMPA